MNYLTIGDLKRMIKDLPDEDWVYYYDLGMMSDINLEIGDVNYSTKSEELILGHIPADASRWESI